MSSRCKACNSILTEVELISKYITTQTYIDICHNCIDKTTRNELSYKTYPMSQMQEERERQPQR